MRLLTRPVEGDHAIWIQPDILGHPAAPNCDAMEGETSKVFTVHGQGGALAVNHNRLLHHPRRQAARRSVSIENG